MTKTELSEKKEFIRAAAVALLVAAGTDYTGAWHTAELLWARKPKDD